MESLRNHFSIASHSSKAMTRSDILLQHITPLRREHSKCVSYTYDLSKMAVCLNSIVSPGELKKNERIRVPLHQLRQSGFVEEGIQKYRQIFPLRCYEVGDDRKLGITMMISFFQEIILNQLQLLGLSSDSGFGITPTMSHLGLIWVLTRMHVEVIKFPSWPDVLEIDTYHAPKGRMGVRWDWVMRSFRTGEKFAHATSTFCTMDVTTRQLMKFPDGLRKEMAASSMPEQSVFPEGKAFPKIHKLSKDSASHVCAFLKATYADLDPNQHVSNLKYVDWVLKSIPSKHIDTHELTSIGFEYKRECGSKEIVESLTGPKPIVDLDIAPGLLSCQLIHLLHTQDLHHEILRGQTTWRRRGCSD